MDRRDALGGLFRRRRRRGESFDPAMRWVMFGGLFLTIFVTLGIVALAFWIGRRMGDKKEDQLPWI
jgi:hypothetical protein